MQKQYTLSGFSARFAELCANRRVSITPSVCQDRLFESQCIDEIPPDHHRMANAFAKLARIISRAVADDPELADATFTIGMLKTVTNVLEVEQQFNDPGFIPDDAIERAVQAAKFDILASLSPTRPL